MAQEETVAKKRKHSIISNHVYSPEFQKLFHEHWHNYKSFKKDNLEVISKPFRMCKISNFLSNEDLMDEIKNELLDVKSRRNSIDLYQFEQTSDLVNVDSKNLKFLYETFQSDLVTWMEQNTKIELNKKISMTSSCYSDTDYLLCHDDNMGDRRIAYILYLSKNWTMEDGGALDLFDTDENGFPRNVVKSLIPEYNSLIFFEVVDNSYHQVAEVTSPEKSRWSINGWFHGPLKESNKPLRALTEPPYIEPVNNRVLLGTWIKTCYLFPGIVKEVQQDMERESFAFLSCFLKDDVYEKVVTDLSSNTIVWQKVGPADIRNYEVAKEETLPEFLKSFYNMFKTISMFQLLKEYTELDLVPEKDSMKPKMTIELQRWTKGCYTLIYDRTAIAESAVSPPGKKLFCECVHQNHEYTEGSVDAPRTSRSNKDNSQDRRNEGSSQDRRNEGGSQDRRSEGSIQDRRSEGSIQDRRSEGSIQDRRSEGSIQDRRSEGSIQDRRNEGSNQDRRNEESGCNSSASNKEDEELNDDDILKLTPKARSTRARKKNLSQQSSLLKLENLLPQKLARSLDTDDSDVSDIGDYLSDPLDCSLECSDQEVDIEDSSVLQVGALDVIIQFQTSHLPEEDTIDYVDPAEQEGALIHVPMKSNHLCLVYKNQGTTRLHKYVNHYCTGYFYNLICTYYE